MSSYFYRGRHRKPTHTGRNVALVATTGALALGGAALNQATANAAVPADALDIIAACESGNRNVPNRTSSASGYWQIIDGTWRANGGAAFAPRAIQATKAEQRIVAQRIAANRGSFADWNPSKSCWGSKIGKALPQRSAPTQPHTSHKHAKPAKPAQAAIDTGRAADGTGTYTCDRAHLHFDACDPHNLGERVQYPKFDRATATVTPAAGAVGGKHRKVEKGDTLTEIAAASGTTWQALYEKNRSVVGDNPNLILPGQTLAL